MERLWFITNPGSGTADAKTAAAIEAACTERGMVFVGQTHFPEYALPTISELDAARADTVVTFAGDGTINAAVCALAEWDGAILILPGGTMNLLAKALHGDVEPLAIVRAAHAGAERIALPVVEAGKHRALVGVIVGPAANWVHPREMVRKGDLRSVVPAMLAAWRRTFGRGVRLTGAAGLPPRVQGAYIWPHEDYLGVAAVDARDFRAIADLGWSWISGDWAAAHAVTEVRADEVRVAERRQTLALFDGEPVNLPPGTRITVDRTGEQFLTTLETAS